MSYKTMLAYLPDRKTADRVLDYAVPLARQNEAHLIGLHVVPRVAVMFAMPSAQLPPDILVQQEENLLADAREVEALFLDRCEKGAIEGEWRCNKLDHADLEADVISQALCNDLLIVHQSGEREFGMGDDLPDRVVMETGRPVLIVPRVGDFASIGRRAIVAWNGSREAARAVFDALPFLQSADSVRVLAINPQSRQGYDSIALGHEMALVLARHGVNAEAKVTSSGSLSVSSELLNQLADEDCDLLVMGGYGHSRLRETLFGGVSHDLLSRMTAPVLMSH